MDASVGTITSNNIELVYLLILEGLSDFFSIKSSSRGSKNCTSNFMDVATELFVKLNPVLFLLFVEASISPLDTPYFLDSILVTETGND